MRSYERNSSTSSVSSSEKQRAWPSIVSALVAAVGSLTIGYAMGYPSSALIDLAELPDGFSIQKGSVESELFAALLPIGAVLGAPLGGLAADRIGRKKALLISGPPNFIGWLMVSLTPYTDSAVAFRVLLLGGRLVTGFAVGWLGFTIPLYASEVSCSKWRGQLTSFYQLSIVLGIFLSYAIGAIPSLTYAFSAIVAMGIILVYELITAVVHESPRWLICAGHDSHAEKALSWLRGSREIAEEEAEEIKRLLLKSPKLPLKQKLLELKNRHVILPVILSLMLIFFHQFSGINVIVFYAATIFQSAGIKHSRETALYAVGGLQIVATFISSFLVDRLGRKVLLFLGSIGMFLGSAALGTHFFLVRPSLCQTDVNSSNSSDLPLNYFSDTCNSHLAPLAISALMLFGFAFSIGWRALPFIVMSELFPLRLRGFLGGMGVSVLWFFAGIVTGFYPNFEEAAGAYTAWWSFALVSFAGTFFVLIFLPETKGKSLEEIEAYFKGDPITHELADPV